MWLQSGSALPLSALGSLGLAATSLAALPRITNPRAARWAYPITLAAMTASIIASILWIRNLAVTLDAQVTTERFSVLLRTSSLAAWWFLALSVALWMGSVLIAYYTPLASQRLRRLFLLLLAGIGALSLAGSGHLLVSIVAWQLVCLPLTLCSAERSPVESRARSLVSVFLADFFSFVLMALGIAFIFAQYQTLSYDLLLESLQAESQQSDILLYSGTALWFAGLLVRLGGVPFHMVTCQRMQSGNLAVSGFSTIFLALSASAFAWGFAGEVLRPTLAQWQDFLSLLGLATVWAGSLGMLVRPQWGGLIAYSLVAQAGWFLLMLTSGGPMTLESEGFFSIAVQSVALLLLFFGALVLARNGGKHAEEATRGLMRSHPALAFLLITSLLTLAGLPPTAGFAAKAMTLSRLATDGLPLLAIAAALSTVAMAYPCLIWVKRIVEPQNTVKQWAFPARQETALLWLFAMGLWILGIWPVIAWPG